MSRTQRRNLQPIYTSSPVVMEVSPYFDESGRLTPAREDFNQFLFDTRKLQPYSSNNNLKLAGDSIVAVIGVGYVGFQLAQAFSKHYPIIAYDVSKARIESVRHDFITKPVYFTTNPIDITQATHVLIAVPTRVHEEDKSIDTSHLQSAIDTITRYARPGAVVVVESSVAVGMTRSLLGPLQQLRGFRIGMSPEVRLLFLT